MAWKIYEIPMPDEVIKRIKQMGIKDRIKPKLTFGNWTLSDKDNDEQYQSNYKLTVIVEEDEEVGMPKQGIL